MDGWALDRIPAGAVYDRPEIVELGTILEITRGNAGLSLDGCSMNPRATHKSCAN